MDGLRTAWDIEPEEQERVSTGRMALWLGGILLGLLGKHRALDERGRAIRTLQQFHGSLVMRVASAGRGRGFDVGWVGHGSAVPDSGARSQVPTSAQRRNG